MERKVGEIFEYNGEWYQCIHTKSLGCENCDLATKSDIHCSDVFEIRGECLSCYRKDSKSVIFKKLEKVGEPHLYTTKFLKAVKFMFKTSWYMKILKIINLYAMIMYYMIGMKK